MVDSVIEGTHKYSLFSVRGNLQIQFRVPSLTNIKSDVP